MTVFARFNAESLSPRARYGLVALAALILFDVSGRLQNMAASAKLERAAAAANLAQQSTDIPLEDWRARAEQAEQAEQAWQSTFWRAQTAGVGAAALQRDLEFMASSHDVKGFRSDVDPEPVEIGGLNWLRLRLEGSLPRENAPEFLANLEAYAPRIVIDELSLSIAVTGSLVFDISASAPILIDAAPQSDEGGDAG